MKARPFHLCLLACLSDCLIVCLSVCLSVCLFVCLFVSRCHCGLRILRGGSLADFILFRHPPQGAALTAIAMELLEAVEYIHSLNIAHRDIKPDARMQRWRVGRVVKEFWQVFASCRCSVPSFIIFANLCMLCFSTVHIVGS